MNATMKQVNAKQPRWNTIKCSRLYQTGFVLATMVFAGVSAFTSKICHNNSPNIVFADTKRRNNRRSSLSFLQRRVVRSGTTNNAIRPRKFSQSHLNSHDGSSSCDLLLPPNCQIYLPSFAFTTTLLEEETSDWEWILWENQPMDSVSLVSSTSTLTPRLENPILAAAATAAWETWRWCANVVVPLQLCPWAPSSVQTPNAIRMYLVVESPTTASIRNSVDPLDQAALSEQRMQKALALAVNHWWGNVQRRSGSTESTVLDPKTAIAFCVDATSKTTARKSRIISVTNTGAMMVDPSNNELQSNDQRHTSLDDTSSSHVWDFDSFYDWYVDLEENQNWWRRGDDFDDESNDDNDVAEQITLAPFHPDWQYYSETGSEEDSDGDEERSCWAFEKKSPHPTISMVATAVVEQAGAAVTERIAINNANVLSKLGSDGLGKLYRDQVWL